eukprot:CAMPEP_0178431670 /NCGR_PEP_ID=MMETSP0689_2-20121128/31977_1 /TAXON_ID=160604 /ORGANISM="Amphidinium massartii, Strain CS-259" /LENGTH=62 /DNA_ID=CAMNT_0020053609 /DNA_START=68 /DNA_END=256 /DNA_ORIENTATION=-
MMAGTIQRFSFASRSHAMQCLRKQTGLLPDLSVGTVRLRRRGHEPLAAVEGQKRQASGTFNH